MHTELTIILEVGAAVLSTIEQRHVVLDLCSPDASESPTARATPCFPRQPHARRNMSLSAWLKPPPPPPPPRRPPPRW